MIKSFKSAIDYLIDIGINDQISYNMQYILEVMDVNDIDQAIHQIAAMLPNDLSGEVMTIAERLRQQGIEQGMQQGMQQGMRQGMQKGMQQGIEKGKEEMALRLLRRSQDLAFISEVTDLTLKQIQFLKKNMIVQA